MDNKVWTKSEIRDLILEFCEDKFTAVGVSSGEINDNSDLYELGVLDSFGIIELLAAIENRTGLIGNPSSDDSSGAVVSLASMCKAFVGN